MTAELLGMSNWGCPRDESQRNGEATPEPQTAIANLFPPIEPCVLILGLTEHTSAAIEHNQKAMRMGLTVS